MASTVIAIGDELLAGFTLDTNSNWLAQQLRVLGFPLKRVTVIRDRQAEIVEQVRRDLCDPEVEGIFCSGGLGPTPDDRTSEAVGVALGRELVTWQPVMERIERRVQRMHDAGLIESSQVTAGNLRMARIPAAPDHVFRNRRGMAPGLMYAVDGHRVFILPGVPPELRSIFAEELAPTFLTGRTAGIVRELRFVFATEARFYPIMRELETSLPDVAVGSYPSFETKELTIRFTGTEEARVQEALDTVRRRVAAMGLRPID